MFANFDSIPAKEAYYILENDKNITLIDVRTLKEFQSGHIPNAKPRPLNILGKNLSKLPKKKNKIIVYCLTGSRSVRASRLLEANGFTPINMSGGYLSWSKDKLPTNK
jgi:rhodanese-related sulfurtransferase